MVCKLLVESPFKRFTRMSTSCRMSQVRYKSTLLSTLLQDFLMSEKASLTFPTRIDTADAMSTSTLPCISNCQELWSSGRSRSRFAIGLQLHEKAGTKSRNTELRTSAGISPPSGSESRVTFPFFSTFIIFSRPSRRFL